MWTTCEFGFQPNDWEWWLILVWLQLLLLPKFGSGADAAESNLLRPLQGTNASTSRMNDSHTGR